MSRSKICGHVASMVAKPITLYLTVMEELAIVFYLHQLWPKISCMSGY